MQFGREWYALSYGDDNCDSKLHCSLPAPKGPDSGPPLDPAPPCDVNALLSAVGSECGNGIIDPGEACDGPALDGVTCSTGTMGVFPHGTVACSMCLVFDFSGCTS